MALNPPGVSKHTEITPFTGRAIWGWEEAAEWGLFCQKISFSEVYLSCVGKTQNLSHRRRSVHSSSSLIKSEIYSPGSPNCRAPHWAPFIGVGNVLLLILSLILSLRPQAAPAAESDNLPTAQQVSWQSRRLSSLPSQNPDDFFPHFHEPTCFQCKPVQ